MSSRSRCARSGARRSRPRGESTSTWRASPSITLFESLLATWGEDDEVRRFVDDASADILSERTHLRESTAAESAQPPGQAADPLARYRVNVLVSNHPGAGAPVITEQHPTYDNLLGAHRIYGGGSDRWSPTTRRSSPARLRAQTVDSSWCGSATCCRIRTRTPG